MCLSIWYEGRDIDLKTQVAARIFTALPLPVLLRAPPIYQPVMESKTKENGMNGRIRTMKWFVAALISVASMATVVADVNEYPVDVCIVSGMELGSIVNGKSKLV